MFGDVCEKEHHKKEFCDGFSLIRRLFANKNELLRTPIKV